MSTKSKQTVSCRADGIAAHTMTEPCDNAPVTATVKLTSGKASVVATCELDVAVLALASVVVDRTAVRDANFLATAVSCFSAGVVPNLVRSA